MRKNMPILNKSNLAGLLALTFLTFGPLSVFNHSYAQSQNSAQNIIITPKEAMTGDTLTVKIKKEAGTIKGPKVFFDKSKVPVFELPNNYYRALIPISANFSERPYLLEVFYGRKGKEFKINVKETKYPIENLTLSKEVTALKASRIEKDSVNKALSVVSEKKLWNDKFIFPSSGRKSTMYGVKRRINGVISKDYFHKGLDFASDLGSNVSAPAPGKVILAGLVSNGFVVNGNCIFLDHGHGVISAYLHLSSVLVKEGQVVKKGDIIGKVGSSGIASGPHLHWGLYLLGMTVDPSFWTSMTIE